MAISGLIFLLDFFNLRASILFNLLHRHIVVSLHGFDVLAKVSDLLVLLRHCSLMVELLLVDLLRVILIDGSLRVAELSRLLLLLLLQSLVPRSVFEHALRVLVSTRLELLMVFIILHLLLFDELILDLVLACF